MAAVEKKDYGAKVISRKPSSTQWLHGEIQFDSTYVKAKYLIVPDGVVEDPKEIIDVMCALWHLSKPKIVLVPVGGLDTPSAWHSQLLPGNEKEWVGPQPHLELKRACQEIYAGVASAVSQSDAWVLARLGNVGDTYASYIGRHDMFGEGRRAVEGQNANNIPFIGHHSFEWPTLSPDWSSTGESVQGGELLGKEELEKCAVPLDAIPSQAVSYRDLREDYLTLGADGIAKCIGDKCSAPNPFRVLHPEVNYFILHRSWKDRERLDLSHTFAKMAPSIGLLISGIHPGHTDDCCKYTKEFPMIVLDKTGGAADVISHCVKQKRLAIQQGRSKDPDVGVCPANYKYVMSYAREDSSQQDETRPWKLPESLDLNRITLLDARSETIESTVDRLLQVVSKMDDDESSQLGAHGFERQQLQQAWLKSITYELNANHMGMMASLLFYATVFISFSTTVSSVSYSQMKQWEGGGGKTSASIGRPIWWMQLVVAVLPLLSGLLLTVASKFNYLSKWALATSAKDRVLSEIYKFRTRVGEYAPKRLDERKTPARVVIQRYLNAMDSETAAAPTGAKRNNTKPKASTNNKPGDNQFSRRNAFATVLSQIHTDMMQGEFKHDTLTEAPDSMYHDLREKMIMKARRKKKELSLQCVSDEQTYQRLLEIEEADRVSREGLFSSVIRGSDEDDTLSVLAADDFVEVRLRTQLERFRYLSARLRCAYYAMQALIFLFTTLSAVLSLLGEVLSCSDGHCLTPSLWIPVVVACITSVTAIIDFEQLHGRLEAVNSAINTLENVLAWWASMSLVEKRLVESREYLVSSVEAVAGADNVWFKVLARVRKSSANKDEKNDKKKAGDDDGDQGDESEA